jgi:transcription elongation factor Elf1
MTYNKLLLAHTIICIMCGSRIQISLTKIFFKCNMPNKVVGQIITVRQYYNANTNYAKSIMENDNSLKNICH